MHYMWKLLVLLASFNAVSADIDNYYCGDHNCYDLLQVTRDNTKNEIKRAFRQIASKTHPDKFLDPDDKKAALEKFTLLQNAYDILKDDEARADYDYMLDHPDEFYMNYYRAWRRRLSPNVDIRIVLAVTISLISLVQFYNGWSKYDEAIKYFATVPKYRLHAIELAKQDGLIVPMDNKKRVKGAAKEEMRKKEEEAIRKIIESKMDIRGVYAKPTIQDLLWVQLVLLPLWTAQYISWYTMWIWKFKIKKEELGDEEKYYLIRKNMSMSAGQFDALDDYEKEEYYKLELWKSDNFADWKAKKDEEIRIKQNQSGRYKAYKRYLRKHGPERMYFDDS